MTCRIALTVSLIDATASIGNSLLPCLNGLITKQLLYLLLHAKMIDPKCDTVLDSTGQACTFSG